MAAAHAHNSSAKKEECCCSHARASRQTSAPQDHASAPLDAAGSNRHEHSHGSRGGMASSGSAANENQEGVHDPVCGMIVDPHTTPQRYHYAGRIYYFCSAGCLAKFSADPQKFVTHAKAPEAVPEGTIYTCPMHPRSVRWDQDPVRSAVWPLSRSWSPPRLAPIQNSRTCLEGSG